MNRIIAAGLLATAATAWGQPLACDVSASPVNVRAEGVTERVADIVIRCTGGDPTAAGLRLPETTIQVVAPVNITNRTFTVSGSNTRLDAALIVDEPASADQRICVPAAGVSNCPGTAGSPTVRNVFHAQVSGTSLVFAAIPFAAPGASGVRILRIVNLRLNASQLGAASGAVPNLSLSILSSGAGATSPIVLPLSNANPIVAAVRPGLESSLAAATANRCAGQNTAMLGSGVAAGEAQMRVQITEGFSNAFKRRSLVVPTAFDQSAAPVPQDSPATSHEAETGYYRTDAAAGLADSGTLVQLRFTNVAPGVGLFVPLTVTLQGGRASGPGAFLRLFAPAGNGSGSLPLQASNSISNALPSAAVAVALAGGSGTAVYEVMHADPDNIEFTEIPVAVAFASGSGAPAAGSASVSVTLGALSTTATASAVAPVPRFVDAGPNRTLLTITATSAGCPAMAAATPSPIAFTGAPGGPSPASRTLTVTSAAALDVTADVYTVSGGRWLAISPALVTANSAGGAITVQVNTTGMTAGEYRGWIRLCASTASGGFVHVPVTLTLGSAPSPPGSVPVLTIDGPATLPSATLRMAYPGVTLTASGVVGLSPRLNWSALGLPPGMSIDVATGRIAGTPTAAGLFQAAVSVTQTASGSASIAASGARTMALFVREAPVSGAPGYTATPTELRFDISSSRPSAPAQSIAVANLPSGQDLLAAVCAIDGRMAPGYPVLTATPVGRTRVDVSLSFRDTPLGDVPLCAPNRVPAGAIVDGSVNEVAAEIRIWGAAVVVVPSAAKPGPREATLQQPDHRVLARIVLTDAAPLAVPKEITFRFNRTRPDLLPPARVIPVIARNLEGRAFTATPRVVSPDTLPDWLRVSAPDGSTPATVTVDIVNPARLPPGVYLAMIDYRVADTAKTNRAADADEPDAKTAVILKIGPGNSFEFVPGERPISDPRLDAFEAETAAFGRAAPRSLNVKAEVVDGPRDWLNLDGATSINAGARIQAKVSQRGLAAGIYTGYIAAWDPRAAANEGAAAELKVTLKIGDGVRIESDPPVVEVTSTSGSTPAQQVDVNADDAPPGAQSETLAAKERAARVSDVEFTPKVVLGNWLSLEPSGDRTPASFKLTADPRGLTPGRNYAGAVTIEAPAALNPLEFVPVSFVVRDTAPLAIKPSRIVPRILNGDGWQTIITAVNPENRRLTTRLSFWSRQGVAGQQTPRPLNVIYRGEEAARTFLLVEIEPLGYATIVTNGRGLLTDDTWATFDEPVHGQIVVRRDVAGKAPFEAAMPMTDAVPSGSYIFFDNTAGYETSIAMLNPGSSTGGFQITARGPDGKVLTRCQFGVTSFGRVQGTRVSDLMQATRGQRGSLELVTLGVTGNNSCRDEDVFDPATFIPGGPMSLMGLREHRDGSIAYLAPMIPDELIDKPGRRIVPFTANGGGWETELWMLNLEFDSKPVFFDFRRANGDAVELTTAAGARRRVSAVTAPLSTTRVGTTRSGAESVLGWVEMPASTSFAGQAMLRRARSTGDIVETHASAVQPPKSRWRGFIDQSGGYTNQIVLTNPSGRAVTTSITMRDETGRAGRTVRVDVGPYAQEAVDLASRLGVTAGTLATLEIVASNGDVLAGGLRSNAQGDLSTSFPLF